MSYSRPTLTALVASVRADILSRLLQDDVLRRSDAEVYARVMAGLAHGLYGFIDWLSRQVVYDTAEAEILERWASIWGVTRKAAVVATGTASFTGALGAVVPQGALVQALDGQQYITTAAANMTGAPVAIAVQAVVAGDAGNRAAGQQLTLVATIAGVQTSATSAALSGGADLETDDALRARLLARVQNPPQGGAAVDYVAWALQVAGVTRAWVYPQELGPGTVTLRFVRDGDAGGLIPDAGEVATVQAYLDALRPVTAQLTVVAPAAVPLNFTIGVTPNTAAVKAAVQAELQDLLLREATPGGTILLSHIRAAISAATGETNYNMTAPVADVVSATGSMSTFGAITWL